MELVTEGGLPRATMERVMMFIGKRSSLGALTAVVKVSMEKFPEINCCVPLPDLLNAKSSFQKGFDQGLSNQHAFCWRSAWPLV